MKIHFFKKIILPFILIFFSSFTAHSEELLKYKIKKNDTLIKILLRNKLTPIYGVNGFLNKTLSLNAEKIKNNGDLIHTKNVIVLPKRGEEKNEEILPAITIIDTPQAISERNPAVELENHFIQKFKQYSFFTLSPRMSSVEINTTNNVKFGGIDISNSTKLAGGIKGEWRVMVSSKLSLFTFASFDRLSFYKDSKYALYDTNFTRTSFGIGQELELTSNSSIETIIRTNQNYYLDALTPNNIQIYPFSQYELQGRYLRKLITIDQVSSRWGIGGIIILPTSNETIKSSLGYGINLGLSVKFLTNEFQLFYMQKFYKTSNVSNQSREVLLNFNFELGRRE